MAAEKPIVVVVHGAFHLPQYYQRLIGPLRQQGYTVLAPALPSTGSDDSINGRTYVDDVRRIHEILLPLLDAGRTAVVVGHSQGGIAASAVAEGQTIEARNYRGLPGGITAVLYVAAFALPAKDMSLIDSIGDPEALENCPYYLQVRCFPLGGRAQCPWSLAGVLTFGNPQGHHCVCGSNAGNAFYNLLPEDERAEASRWLVHQSRASQTAPVRFVASDVTVPKTYVVCKHDNVFPVSSQISMAKASGCRVLELDADHSPFLGETTSKQLVSIIVDAAGK